MIPCSFDESNAVLSKPRDMSADECDALSVLRAQTDKGVPVVISCYKITKQELEELAKTGRIWLCVCGETMPPLSLSVEKPFAIENNTP